MKNTDTGKWDIGWRTVGKPKIVSRTEQGAVAVATPTAEPATKQAGNSVIVKSVAHPGKPKVPLPAPVAVKPAAVETVVQTKQEKPRVTPAKMPASQNKVETTQTNRDMQSGMELLGVEFVLDLAEKTDFDTRDEAVMHNIGLNELIRRGSFELIDSNTLAAYVTNDGNFYSTQIQCSAMQVLAQRTVGDN